MPNQRNKWNTKITNKNRICNWDLYCLNCSGFYQKIYSTNIYLQNIFLKWENNCNYIISINTIMFSEINTRKYNNRPQSNRTKSKYSCVFNKSELIFMAFTLKKKYWKNTCKEGEEKHWCKKCKRFLKNVQIKQIILARQVNL